MAKKQKKQGFGEMTVGFSRWISIYEQNAFIFEISVKNWVERHMFYLKVMFVKIAPVLPRSSFFWVISPVVPSGVEFRRTFFLSKTYVIRLSFSCWFRIWKHFVRKWKSNAKKRRPILQNLVFLIFGHFRLFWIFRPEKRFQKKRRTHIRAQLEFLYQMIYKKNRK